MASHGKSVRHGPSEDDWARHKNYIIHLYYKSTLPEIRHIMKRDFNFDASKRMYDTRFRKWGVTKILKRIEKEDMARQLGETGVAAAISEKDYKKVMRFLHTQSRDTVRGRNGGRQQGRNNGNLGHHPPTEPTLPLSDMDWSAFVDEKFGLGQDDSLLEEFLTPTSSVSDVNSSDDSSESTFRSTPSGSQMTPTPPIQQALLVSPRSALSPSPAAQNKEHILRIVNDYYSTILDRVKKNPSTGDIFSIGSTPASKLYWNNIKNGIYLWKIEAHNFSDPNNRARRAFLDAFRLADQALMTAPVDFCRELLATLSPTNTSINPNLRKDILTYLAAKASTVHPGHPIANLCIALKQDENCPDVSFSALRAMNDLFFMRLGASDTAPFKLITTLIKSMRRAGELETARGLAESTLRLAQQFQGAGSDQARSMAVELSHILTTLGEYGRTLQLRLDVVEQPRYGQSLFASNVDSAVQYRRDGIAVYCMEDLAEYYIRFGNYVEGYAWLSRALAIGLDLWGDCASTGHVKDKLSKLRARDLSGQVVDGKIPGVSVVG